MNPTLQKVFDIFDTISHWIPHALGVLLLLGLLYFVYYKVKNRKTDEPEGDEESNDSLGNHRSHRSASWFRLRRNLRRALSTLKANVYGRHHRYQIPWFLLIGETGSGKTEALHHTDITLPLGAPRENIEGSREGWKWWFFDQGIVIDVDGDYVLRTDGHPTDHKGWKQLLKLLQNHRPQRPIDGIILTIPATDLIGPPETLNERVIKVGDKASALFDKMVSAQKVLGMRLPVYLMVTKCDHIRGFKSFCGELPKGLQQDVLGWSNPYTLDTGYSPVWIDEAFENLYKNLYQTQIEVIVDGIQVQDSDDFFMFPSAFSTMMEPLRTYTNHLFKQSVYHEALFFRGMFFCGDATQGASVPMQNLSWSKAPESDTESVEPDLLPELSSASSTTSKGPKRLAFLKDLFEQKIFPEFRLARPTGKIFLWRSRLTWGLRAALIGIALFWSLGLWWSYHDLEKDNETLMPVLNGINKNLGFLEARYSDEELSFNKMAEDLLKGMTNINTSSLTNVFIPWSWFSNLDYEVRQAMVIAYDKIILKSLYFKLEEKIKESLQGVEDLNTEETFEETFDEQGADITPVKLDKIPEMQRLNKTVQDLAKLWQIAQLYNGLQKSKDLSQLGEVVKFLFNFPLSEDFYQNAAFYHNALKDVEYSSYDPTITRYLLAIPEVRGMSQDLLERLFEKNIFLARLEDISQDIENNYGEGARYSDQEGNEGFGELLSKILEMKQLVARPEFAWMGEPKFNLGPEFNTILTSIETSPFLGQGLRQEIGEMGNAGFDDLTFQLRRQQTSLTGALLKEENGQIKMQLAESVIKIENALHKFMNHDFMKVEDEANDLVKRIELHDRLIWDPATLRSAIALYQDFKGFEQSTLPLFPDQLKNLALRASRKKLEFSMNQLLAKSQDFKPVKSGKNTILAKSQGSRPAWGNSDFRRTEEELAKEIRSFKKSAPLLGQMMDIYSELGFTKSFGNLSRLVNQHGFHLLNNVNLILNFESLYAFKDGNFSWWNGLTPASLEAYETLDQQELSYFLSIQRERIKYLARQYSEPLVNFLINRTINRGRENEKLVVNWHRILVELDRYDAKQTSNTLTLLERFIKVEMGTITPENCRHKIPLADLKHPARGFFGEKLYRLKKELSAQCRLLARDEVLRDYSAVQAFFNQRIAGRYPFAPIDQNSIIEEADPADLRKFYYMLDGYLDSSLGQLEKSTKFGHSKDNALEFIYLMEEARPFFAPYLTLEKSELPAYLLDIDFRVNRVAESGANQVIEWKFETKGETVQAHRKKKVPLQWDLGDPIRLSFRWAKDSPDVPVSSGDWLGVNVNKRTVTFEYDNQWSLIQLLSRQEAGGEDFGPLGDPKPHTLRFKVNTLERDEDRMQKEVFTPKSGEARFFIRVVVKSSKTKERVVLPALPFKAPLLKNGFNS